jgi:2-dehydro-3-deoxy-L-rhamnonate dehydrogenase (NAD+)
MVFYGRFAARTAVVTGGASGIGLAVAKRLVLEGARVSLWDSNGGALDFAKSHTGAIHVSVVDVTDAGQVMQSMNQSITALEGKLDVLVASAGVTGPNESLADYPVDAWRRVVDVNLNGLFYCNQAAVRAMKQTGYGRIVNISSIAGKEGNPNASAYSASKAAVIGLTKSLGKELAKTAIRVNCVTPAAIRTAMFNQMKQEHIDFMLSKIPLGRFGLVEEACSLICWLASEECSFSTAAVFDVSGGRATY